MDGSSIKILKTKDSADFNKSVIKVGTDWCSACKKTAPTYEKLATKYTKKGIRFYEINAERSYESKTLKKLAAQTQAYPTFYFFKDRELVNTMSGLKVDKFVEYLNRL